MESRIKIFRLSKESSKWMGIFLIVSPFHITTLNLFLNYIYCRKQKGENSSTVE